MLRWLITVAGAHLPLPCCEAIDRFGQAVWHCIAQHCTRLPVVQSPTYCNNNTGDICRLMTLPSGRLGRHRKNVTTVPVQLGSSQNPA
ncbi:hypothetical protein QBC34DRAFT_130203 [Podospora aff. communis PSN243]|uniref:Secreted protein n=1 Tax=Podospora aff. communis PSN243 TaxID=3040156 RepID=A0AAV9GGD0_9PEZI|nr:hypothetical protein QBC34DRAFT_130203 [Podospora aff. communis PSN243]